MAPPIRRLVREPGEEREAGASDRKKRIEEAAFKATTNRTRGTEECWIEGAHWADAHPYRLKKKSGAWGIKVCPQCKVIETSTKNEVCSRCKANPAPPQVSEAHEQMARSEYPTKLGRDHDGDTVDLNFFPRATFLAGLTKGREGMVPASEVERLKEERDELRGLYDEEYRFRSEKIAEAVNAAVEKERERCLAAIEATSVYDLDSWLGGPKQVRYLILNPKPEGG